MTDKPAAGPWRKYPDEKPEKYGFYLLKQEATSEPWAVYLDCEIESETHEALFGNCVTHWAEINLPDQSGNVTDMIEEGA